MKTLNGMFIGSSCVLLAMFAAAKLATALMHGPALEARDEIFLLRNREMLVAVGLLECAVVGYLLGSSTAAKKLRAIVWLGGMFLTYRLGLEWMGIHRLCGCLGQVGYWSPRAWPYVAVFTKACLAYLLGGSTLLLLLNRGRKPGPATSEVKTSPPPQDSGGTLL
jgi:hypothetical protein